MQTLKNGGINNYEKLFAGAKVDAITEVYVASLLVGKQRDQRIFNFTRNNTNYAVFF